MKLFLSCGLLILSAAALFAGEFKTLFIGASPDGIRVEDGEFMLIRNFTQDQVGTSRGVVTFNHRDGNAVAILSASIQTNSSSNPEEVVNSVIVAGPGIVKFQCGDGARCLATFKIDSNN